MTDQWLSGLHPGWETRRPQTLFAERREASRAKDVHLTPSQHHGVLPQQEYMELTGSKVVLNLTGADNMKHVEPDDFIIHLRSFQGGIEHSRFRGKVSNAYTVLTPLNGSVDARFFRWVMKSPGFIQELQSTTNQLRDGQSIGFAEFRTITLPLPPVEEQRRIADFLDDQTTRIDQIIAAREQQIEMLEEQRSAHLDAHMCQAGFPVVPLRRLLLRAPDYGANAAAEHDDRSYPRYIRTTDVTPEGSLRDETFRSLPPEVARPYLLQDGDVLFTRSGATVGKSFIYRDSWGPSAFAGYLIRIRVDPSRMYPEWLRYFTDTPSYWRQISESAIQATIANVNAEKYGDMTVPAPSLEVQRALVESFAANAGDLRVASRALSDSIGLLQEFKRSLVSAAVSGELDVSVASGRGVPA